jgi:hypothetical protein
MNAEKKFQTEALLKVAERYQWEGMKAFDAVELAAKDLGLPVAAEDSACKVYRVEAETVTNCWVG